MELKTPVYPPDNQRRIQDESRDDHGQYKTGDQAQDRVRIREGHDRQANVLSKEQRSSLLAHEVSAHGLEEGAPEPDGRKLNWVISSSSGDYIRRIHGVGDV